MSAIAKNQEKAKELFDSEVADSMYYQGRLDQYKLLERHADFLEAQTSELIQEARRIRSQAAAIAYELHSAADEG